MRSILEEFALGNINPNDGTIKKGTRYAKVMNLVVDIENKLFSALDEEPKVLFSKYSNAQLEANAISNNDKFIYGYRLGVLMTMEVFKGSDDNIFGGEVL